MVAFSSVRTDEAKKRMDVYAKELDDMNLAALVAEFFTYLDYTETKGMDDHEIHPITIGSCRILLSQPLGMVLQKLRDAVK